MGCVSDESGVFAAYVAVLSKVQLNQSANGLTDRPADRLGRHTHFLFFGAWEQGGI